MSRHIQGLKETAPGSQDNVPDGVFLVRVDKAQYRWHASRPFYLLRLSVIEPHAFAGCKLSGRLYCSPKALWKLGWFLRDFFYDAELLSREEVDEKAFSGLCGVVKISHMVVNGVSLLSFDGFAPASQWLEFSEALSRPTAAVEVAE
ncbi:MAG: hypothetical protein M3O09_04325 [Acidobacteriota bacterium]|nr:hypothetical protein [Acidobacteriota bacterium]